MTITQPCLQLYSFLKSVSSCMKGLTESWFILFSSCALQRVLSPLPRITGPHDWDGGWQGSMPHWIFHSSGSFNPPRWLLSKAVLFLEQTHHRLENVHWRCLFAELTHGLVSYTCGCENTEISMEGNQKKEEGGCYVCRRGMLCFIYLVMAVGCDGWLGGGWWLEEKRLHMK